MFKKTIRLFFIVLSLATLTACGMKGSLEHPQLAHLDLQMPATIAKI